MLNPLRPVAVVIVLGLATLGFAGTAQASLPAAATAPVSASGACSAAGSHVLSKTRFLLHAGIAFGSFHRYIYKPLRRGAFGKGANGRTKAFVKAGGTALLVIHEVGQAKKFAESDPTLCKLVAPLDSLSSNLSGLASKLKDGSATTADLDAANNQVSQVSSLSNTSGSPITER